MPQPEETSPPSEINIEKIFKGIIPYYPNNIIYAILNFNEISTIPKNTKWVTVSEIEKNNKISPNILNFFTENSYVNKLHTAYLTEVLIPEVMFLCKITDSGEYVNIFQKDITIPMIIPRSYIKEKGDFFLFSKTPILSTTDENEIVKALIFMDKSDTSVILKDSTFSFGSPKFTPPFLFNEFTYQNNEYVFIKQYDSFMILKN